jgi:hypothetical protein
MLTNSSNSAGYMGNEGTGYRVLEAEGVTISVLLPFITSMVVWRGEVTRGEKEHGCFDAGG